MNWPLVPLLNAISDVSSGNTKIAQRDYQAHGRLPIIDQGSSFIGGYTDDESARHSSKRSVIIFGDHTRVFKFVDFPFAMGADGVKVLVVNDGWDARFVFHFLQSIKLPNAGYSRHFKFLKSETIPSFPLPEQRRIAAILDQASNVVQKRGQALEVLSALGVSIFDKEFSHSTFPRVPIAELGSIHTGKTPPTRQPGFFNGQTPFVTPGDLGSGQPTSRSISAAGLPYSRTARSGSTLVCCIGATIGKSDIASSKVAFNQQINAIEWGERVDDIFGLFAIRRIKQRIVAMGTSTTMPILSKKKFSILEIEVPPIGDQRTFSTAINNISIRKASLERSAKSATELMISLQSRAFRGEL